MHHRSSSLRLRDADCSGLIIGAKISLARLCWSAKPLTSQLSMLNGVCPMVVDHILRIIVAWKNSIDWGVSRSALASRVLAS